VRDIELPEVNPRAFRAVLTYLYTSFFDASDDVIIDVAQLADQYSLTTLFEECVGYVKRNLGVRNAGMWLMQSDRHGLSTLRAEALHYLCGLCKNLDDIKTKVPQAMECLTAALWHEVFVTASMS